MTLCGFEKIRDLPPPRDGFVTLLSKTPSPPSRDLWTLPNYPCTIWAHLGTIPCLSLCFSFEILKEKNIVTKQMKNEYFQENKEKSIEYTREMILSDDQNEIIES